MFSDDEIRDHPNPDLLINMNEAEEKIAAENAAKRRANYEAVQLARRRFSGWTAERQRTFLAALADTGCVSVAAEAAEITPRSCYRLRRHPKGAAFAKAWDDALLVATGRLVAIAFERAIIGTPREIWRGGKLVAEMSIPSDKMMMFMLQRLMPLIYGQTGPGNGTVEAQIAHARTALPDTLGALTDVDEESPDALVPDDYKPLPPRDEGA
ncbi:hypothetical protein AB5I39_04530 [Sphingomonas sp. MMS24-J45]|uniref:hypothetical protein n=1 Tax=Sphingomonas sp. MMS24-J45 TaxID=3238806 RepID=UPI00384D483E